MGFLSEADFLQNTLTTIHYTGKTSINLLNLLILHFHTTTTTTANNIYMRGSQHN